MLLHKRVTRANQASQGRVKQQECTVRMRDSPARFGWTAVSCRSEPEIIRQIHNNISKTKVYPYQEISSNTVIAEIFVRVKISYSSVCQLSYARNFRTATVVSDTLVYVYGFRMLLNFVLSAKSTKYTKLNRVRKFVRLQYYLFRKECHSTFSVFSSLPARLATISCIIN